MLYSCTHTCMATVGVKGLKIQNITKSDLHVASCSNVIINVADDTILLAPENCDVGLHDEFNPLTPTVASNFELSHFLTLASISSPLQTSFVLTTMNVKLCLQHLTVNAAKQRLLS